MVYCPPTYDSLVLEFHDKLQKSPANRHIIYFDAPFLVQFWGGTGGGTVRKWVVTANFGFVERICLLRWNPRYAARTFHGRGAATGGFGLGADAHNALSVALRVMQENGPNARDYYPQGDGVIRVAVAEHCARLAKLESVREG
jgi:hypothetical protein